MSVKAHVRSYEDLDSVDMKEVTVLGLRALLMWSNDHGVNIYESEDMGTLAACFGLGAAAGMCELPLAPITIAGNDA
eukprot:7075219-Pyramimonas_sp.AAC.1